MYRYLIIDDESLIRKGTIKKLKPLESLVVCCGEAENGEEGIRMTELLDPDIIILDMQMPVMNGMELLPWLSEHFPDKPLIVISGFQNFEYMKQAISSKAVDYILKPFSKEEIQKTMLSAMKNLQNSKTRQQQILSIQEEKEEACYALDRKLMYNLLMGYDTGDARVSSQKLSFVEQGHDLVLCTFYLSEGLEIENAEKWLAQNGFSDLTVFLQNSSVRQFGYMILFLPAHDTGNLQQKKLLRKFLDAFRVTNRDRKLLIGISDIHEDVRQLHIAYLETMEALNAQKVYQQQYGELFYTEAKAPVDILWEKGEEFLFRIESGRTDLVKEMTEELFCWYQEIPECTLADVKRHCEYVASRCREILSFYLKQQGGHNGSPNMQAIVNTLFTFEDVKEYYLQFYINIARLLEPHSVYNTNELVEQIKIYMERNYQKNITQEFLASLFFLNRSYLSQMFRRKTGQKFIDYLNEIRIQKAKEQLIHTNKKMYQIARSVGYDNVKYFFRIFRKKTGMSPEQFREKNAE